MTMHLPRRSAPFTVVVRRTLVRWLRQESETDSQQLPWTLYDEPSFADLWYGARIAGEHLRAHALRRLYTARRTPGGKYPDPRKPASFSTRAVVAEAARYLGITVWPLLQTTSSRSRGRRKRLAFIVTYPDAKAPTITAAYPPDDPHMYFNIACLLGYIYKERTRIMDPDAPYGLILLPQDPQLTSILHQFAIGLLCLADECPKSWKCACNDIRARFNAPPPDHEQQTDALSLKALRTETERQRHKQA